MFETLPTDLKDFRVSFGATQHRMAQLMGMPLRSYQDIEAGANPVRPIHVKAALFAAIVLAAEGNGYRDLPFELGELVRQAGR